MARGRKREGEPGEAESAERAHQESGHQWPQPRGCHAGSSSSVALRSQVKTEGQVLEMVAAVVLCGDGGGRGAV